MITGAQIKAAQRSAEWSRASIDDVVHAVHAGVITIAEAIDMNKAFHDLLMLQVPPVRKETT